jgi:hypothetical protein
VTTGKVLRKHECCGIFALVRGVSRLYACCAACALAVASVENLALIERDCVEQALLGNVGDEPVELGALQQRQQIGEELSPTLGDGRGQAAAA